MRVGVTVNISSLTRREQVLQRLKDAAGAWVDGPDLANEKVGGSEGLKRLRELRMEGHEIEMRKHPDMHRNIWQYRLHPERRVVPIAEKLPIQAPTKPMERFTQMPKSLAFGEAIPCPRCNGKGTGANPMTHKQGPCIRCNGFGVVPVPRS